MRHAIATVTSLERWLTGNASTSRVNEQRVWELFKGKQHPMAFRAAMNTMRFQGGMRSRFAEGLVRSWSYCQKWSRPLLRLACPLS